MPTSSGLNLLRTDIRHEQDVVLARQRARQIAAALKFDSQAQTRIATAVSEIARNAFQYAGGSAVEFRIDNMELTIFRVIQESLTNVHRHSHSRTAEVKLKTDVDRVFLEITDQGAGFPSTSQSGTKNGRAVLYGIGIRGLKERVQQFGGELIVKSDPSGTSLQALLPKPPA